MRRIFSVLLASVVLALPLVVFGAPDTTSGLVPCDGPECQVCHVVALGQRLINFFVTIAILLAVGIFAWAGFLMLTSAGNEGQVTKARGMFTNVLIGLVIVLTGWLIIDTVMKYAFEESELETDTRITFGPWNELRCVKLPELRNPTPGVGRVTVGGGTDNVISSSGIADRIARTNAYKAQLCGYGKQNGVEAQCAHLQAIMAIESNGAPGAVSPAGAVGLMQILPSTALRLDPRGLEGLSPEQIIEKLKDPDYNMKLGVLNYAQDYKYFNGDFEKVTAAFNGGRDATNPSNDCPGLMKWQCVWDSPGCYGTSRTDCTPNTGYNETRNYVTNVKNILTRLRGG